MHALAKVSHSGQWETILAAKYNQRVFISELARNGVKNVSLGADPPDSEIVTLSGTFRIFPLSESRPALVAGERLGQSSIAYGSADAVRTYQVVPATPLTIWEDQRAPLAAAADQTIYGAFSKGWPLPDGLDAAEKAAQEALKAHDQARPK